MFTALVLDSASQSLVLKEFGHELPHRWLTYAHHMTINMGPSTQGPASGLLGQKFTMTVTAIGRENKIIALQVHTKCPSDNKLKHITLAVDKKNGGKPVMANDITNWEWLNNDYQYSVQDENNEDKIILTGTIEEL